MEDKEIFDKVVTILSPYAKNKDELNGVNKDSSILKDLNVNSSRLVDIILAMEDEFDIEIEDSEADKVNTIGAAVEMIKTKI